MKKILEFFGIKTFYNSAYAIWNFFMTNTYALMGYDLDKISPKAYKYVTETAYPFFYAIGGSLLAMFLLIGYLRKIDNLKEGITYESFLEMLIKLFIAEGILLNSTSLMNKFISISSTASKYFLGGTPPNLVTTEMDLGTYLLSHLLMGIVFAVMAFICGATILLTVFKRFLNLYMVIAVCPLATVTIAGGRGIENTFYAWMKTFFTETFKVVIIALALRLSGLMVSSMGYINTNYISGLFDGALATVTSMLQMLIVTAFVKGSDELMKRMFDLR